MAKFSELRVKFTGDTANLSAAMRQVNAQLSEAANTAQKSSIGFTKWGQSMSNVGSRMMFGLTAPIVGFGVAALKLAGDMEVSKVAFTTMLKSGTAATAMLKELKQFAMTTPFQFTELTDATRRMLALGFTAKEVIPTLRVIGDAAGALGLGAEGIQRITLALGQMKAKGTVQAEEMRQLAEAGIPAWDALAKKLNTDVGGAMKLVEQRAVSAAVGVDAAMTAMRDRFGGGMAAQAKTMLGTWSNVMDAMKFALADVGAALLPAAKNLLTGFILPLADGASRMAKAFSELPLPVQGALLAIGGIVAVAGPVIFILGQLAQSVVSLNLAMDLLSVGLIAPLANLARIAVLFTTLSVSTGVAALGMAGFVAAASAATAGIVAAAYAIGVLAGRYLELRDAQGQQAGAEAAASAARTKAIDSIRSQAPEIEKFVTAWNAGRITTKEMDGILRDFALTLGESKRATVDFEEAAKSLGFSTTKQLAQELAKARDNLAAVAVAFKAGSASADDLANAQNRVKQINDQLHPSIKGITEALTGMTGAMQGPISLWDELGAAIQRNQLSAATDQITKMADAWSNAKDRAREFLDLGAMGRQVEFQAKLTIPPTDVDLSGLPDNLAKRQEQAFKIIGIGWKQVGKDAKDASAAQAGAMRKMAVMDAMKAMQIQPFNEAMNLITRGFDNVSSGIAKVIVEGGKVGDVFKKLGVDIKETFLRTILNQALMPLRKAMTLFVEWMFSGDGFAGLAKLGKDLVGIFKDISSSVAGVTKATGSMAGMAGMGGSAGGVAGGVAGGAGGAGGAGASAATGVMGIVGVVAGVVSAISSVIGNFQMAGMNKSLDLIVQHTLRTANQLIYGIQPSLNQWLPGVQGIQERLIDIANIMKGGDMTFAGGGSGVAAGTIAITIGNVYGGPAGLDSLTDEIIRRLQARGLKIG